MSGPQRARADVPSRACALTVSLAAIGLSVVGITSWVGDTPTTVALMGDRHPPDGTGAGWDLLLTACAGAGLWLGTIAARWAWPTPAGRRLAAFARTATALAVGCHVLVTVLVAAGTGSAAWVPGLASVATVAGYGALLPAGLVAVSSSAVAAWRCVIHTPTELARRARHRLDSVPPGPLEADDPPAPAAGEAPSGRWARAYRVPGVDPDAITRRWRRGEHTTGICLSGGGVRAASVALGALQSLRSELLGARHLVSVSGGGYTAGAFQQALTAAGHPGLPGTPLRDPETAFGEDSAELHHVRRHSSYLADTPLQVLAALARILRGLILSLTVLFGPAVVLGVVAGWFATRVPLTPLTLDPLRYPVPRGSALAALGVVAAAAFLLALHAHAASARRVRSARVARDLAAISAVITVLVLVVPLVVWMAAWLVAHTQRSLGVTGPVGTVLLTYLAALAAMVWRHRTVIGAGVSGLLRKRGTGGIPAAVPKGLVQRLLVITATGVLALLWLFLFGAAVATLGDPQALWVAGGVAVVTLVLGAGFDSSSLSLHPFYRRRLASAFAVRPVRRGLDGQVVAVPYAPSERTTLSTYGRVAAGVRFPEVVFAASANLTGEARTPPGLNAVSFTMSADWTGGPDVGWVRTRDLEEIVTNRFRRDLTVQGAVAVSGAAFASAMGRSSRWYQVLLAVSGARLGAWLPNPGFVRDAHAAAGHGDWTHPWLPRGRRLGYLLREVFGVHPHTDRLLHVTDGGHYDNLGLVELFRRRCTRIICVDSSNDAPPTATTLAEALTLAAQELGVRVELDDPWAAEPGSGEPAGPDSPLAARLARCPVITGTVHYPPESGVGGDVRGRLVVARAVLWPRVPYRLLSYAAHHPEFPYDSTGDQWFDHTQFAAYTELGRSIGAAAREAVHASDPRADVAVEPASGDVPTPATSPEATGPTAADTVS